MTKFIHSSKKLWLWLALSGLVVLLVGVSFLIVQSQPPANPTSSVRGANGQITVVAPPANPAAFSGTAYYVKNYNVYAATASSSGQSGVTAEKLNGKALTSFAPNTLTLVGSPALAPDGKRLAFSYSPAPVLVAGSGTSVSGGDIWQIDLATNLTSTVVARLEPDTYLENPVWSADGRYLYYQYRRSVRAAAGGVSDIEYGIERVELNTNRREIVVKNAQDPAPSPDNTQLVFVRTGTAANNYRPSLMLKEIGMDNERTLATTEQGFISFYRPRISPDGQKVAFAANGGAAAGSLAPASGQGRSSGSGIGATYGVLGLGLSGKLVSWWPKTGPALHGDPWDLWTLELSGANLTRLTSLLEDQPMAVWAKDGQSLTFLGAQGLYRVSLPTKTVQTFVREGSHGGFDYQP